MTQQLNLAIRPTWRELLAHNLSQNKARLRALRSVRRYAHGRRLVREILRQNRLLRDALRRIDRR